MEYSRRSMLDYMMASAVSGSVSRVLVHPIDTVRAQLQVQRGSNMNTLSLFSKVLRTEGARGLYRGLGAGICFGAPASALYLGTYDWTKSIYAHALRSYIPANSPFIHFAGALSAEAISGLVWTPMDVIKQRLQVQRLNSSPTPKYKNTVDAMKVIYREEGLRTFFKGYGLQIGVFGPYTVLKFLMYEDFKKRLAERWGTERLPTSAYTWCAVVSGGLAAAVTNPLDVIKTRIQVQYGQTQKYKNFKDALVKIFREEGIRAFTKGMMARILWIAPTAAINLTLYEEIKLIVQGRKNHG